MFPARKSRKPAVPLLLALLVLGLLAWAPWISAPYARQRAETAFTAAWQGVVDGCGTNCTGCGATRAEKIWFGWQVELEYACGMLPADTPEYHEHAAGFVSFLGSVNGFPRP
jgi:hypothetical protein